MNPSFRNLFMKKFPRERVVPTISEERPFTENEGGAPPTLRIREGLQLNSYRECEFALPERHQPR
jgi:hypothetical protein